MLSTRKPFSLYMKDRLVKRKELARSRWLTPVILATQEAEIRRIVVQSQPGEIVPESFTKIGLVKCLKV
jgi:hypothetical protein